MSGIPTNKKFVTGEMMVCQREWVRNCLAQRPAADNLEETPAFRPTTHSVNGHRHRQREQKDHHPKQVAVEKGGESLEPELLIVGRRKQRGEGETERRTERR